MRRYLDVLMSHDRVLMKVFCPLVSASIALAQKTSRRRYMYVEGLQPHQV